jgi:hypothetical protein
MRERWHNQLDPNIRKDPWTPEEDQRLLMAYQACLLPDRSSLKLMFVTVSALYHLNIEPD